MTGVSVLVGVCVAVGVGVSTDTNRYLKKLITVTISFAVENQGACCRSLGSISGQPSAVQPILQTGWFLATCRQTLRTLSSRGSSAILRFFINRQEYPRWAVPHRSRQLEGGVGVTAGGVADLRLAAGDGERHQDEYHETDHAHQEAPSWTGCEFANAASFPCRAIRGRSAHPILWSRPHITVKDPLCEAFGIGDGTVSPQKYRKQAVPGQFLCTLPCKIHPNLTNKNT